MKRYGDPANLPGWLPGARPRAALLQIGRVLDDIRLLHSEAIERAVLMFTLWARALLLVLAPTLGALSFAPAPDLDGSWPRLVPWVVALVWAIATALAAPRIGALAMEDSVAGLRTRRVLLAVELPLAVALALTHPGWPAVAFAAGWTNWWQRLGPTPAVPDFSWPRLAAWVSVTAGAQAAGLILGAGDVVWWAAVLEVAVTLGVIAVIGGSYGAMLPVSASVAGRVLLSGARHRRLAAGDAQRIIDDIAEAMTLAADELTRVADRRPADAAAADVLRRAVDTMRPVASAPDRRGPATLGALVTAALVEGGHDMWVEDPRALAAQARARAEGRPLPVVVQRPEFSSDDVASVVVDEAVAATLHELLVACIVEARVHGARRVQTIVQRAEGRIEFRVANQPSPEPTRRRGRGRGGRTVTALAAALPGSGELFRGPTNYAFVGRQPAGVLFGVRFSFTASDTPPDAGDSTRPHL